MYCYPREAEIVKKRMEDADEDRDRLITTLAEQGFDRPHETRFLPIDGHRYLACAANPKSTVVLSIAGGNDAMVYGNSFKEYLGREFLRDSP